MEFQQAVDLPLSTDLKLPDWFSIMKVPACCLSEIHDTLSSRAK